MSTSRILGKTLAFPALLTPSSRALTTARAAHIPRRVARSAGRAAWLFGIVAPLVLALALSWQMPSAMAAPRVPAGGGIGPGNQAVVEVDGLALRSGAGLNCPVLTRMPKGVTVTVVSGPTSADNYDWYQVTYNGKTGYAAGQYLSGVSGGGGQPCQSPCGSLTPGGYASVTVPYLNMRCGPSINCPISMSLPQGSIVKLLDGPTSSDGHSWWKVSFGNNTGYVAGEYLTPASGPSTSPQSCTSDCSSLVVGNDAQVTSATLNLRTGPGISCPINTTMPHGATVKVLDGPTQADGYNWYKVSYNGTVGYAAGAYLAPVSGTGGHGCQTNCGGPHVGEDAYVRDTPFLHLRNGAGMTCDIEASMPEGAKVHVMDGPTHVDNFDWYHVSYTDQGGHDWDGYAAGDWLGTPN
jgi:uncharacterized protein YgiM (DUF1202 family)